MIDRNARKQMSEAIQGYMDEDITAFQFDDALTKASCVTSDKTAKAIRDALWFYYDDCKDHKIVASKQDWDYFNRLLLLLESDGEIENVKSWYEWHFNQFIAAFLLVLFVASTFREGFGGHLIGFALPFGPPSMILAWFNQRRQQKNTTRSEISLTPFPTFGSLLAVRRLVVGFRKHSYPHAIAKRRIRDYLTEKLMWIPWSMMWCMFSPIVLFFQMLPRRMYETRITMSLPSAEDNRPTSVTQK